MTSAWAPLTAFGGVPGWSASGFHVVEIAEKEPRRRDHQPLQLLFFWILETYNTGSLQGISSFAR